MNKTTAQQVPSPESGPKEPEGRPSLTSTFDVLNLPVYRTVWIGTVLAFTAFNISTTAQGVVAYDLTGSNRAVGLVQFGQGVAMAFLNPFSGALVDRVSKRRLIVGAQSIIGIVMLTIAILILSGVISVLFLALGSFIVGACFSFNGPTRTALLSEVVPEHRIGRAMALVQVGGNFARITGPFVAGLLLSWSLIGSGGTYLVVAAIMIFVTFTMYQIPPTPVDPDREVSGFLDDVKHGFSYVGSNPKIFHTVVSFHMVAVVGLSYFVLMPGFAKDTLDSGTAGLGILLGSAAIGGLLFSLVVATFADSDKVPILLSGACLLMGLSLVGAGLAPSFGYAVVAMIFVGGGSSAFQTLNNVAAARYSDKEYLGRVISLMFMAWGLNGLAGLPVGYLADIAGERAVLMGMGGSVCVLTFVLAFWYRLVASNEAQKQG